MPYQRTFDEPSEPLEKVCRHLRTKGILVSGQMEPPAEMEDSGSGHCWCGHTQHVFGPDNALVARRECNSSRTCYEAVL